MKHFSSGQSLSVFVLATAVFFTGLFFAGDSFANDFPLHDKLEKCEAAFDKMQSGKLTQEEAWIARREHKKLAREILASLNKRNASLTTISNEEVLNNLKVMGRLLEMISTDHPTMTDEWGYPLIR
jgi:hypothetical protein